MNQEEVIRELQRQLNEIKSKYAVRDLDAEAEVEEIDVQIEDYDEQITELEEKLSDESNYSYDAEENGEDMNLIAEAYIDKYNKQLEDLDRDDREQENNKTITKRLIRDCNKEIKLLNASIAQIERRLLRNEAAIRRNMAIRLSDEEVSSLTAELESKKDELAQYKMLKEASQSEVKEYEEQIKRNQQRRQTIIARQDRVKAVQIRRANNAWEYDKSQMRLDQDKLTSLKAGREALKTRRELLTFDVEQAINNIQAGIDSIPSNPQVEVRHSSIEIPTSEPAITYSNNYAATAEPVEAQTNYDVPNIFFSAPLSSGGRVELPEYVQKNEPIVETQNVSITDPEEEAYREDIFADRDIDRDREAEIKEASEMLIEKKNDKGLMSLIKKYKNRFCGLLLAVVVFAGSKGCTNVKDANKQDDIVGTVQPPSYSQSGDVEEDKGPNLVVDPTETPAPSTPSPEIEQSPTGGNQNGNNQMDQTTNTPEPDRNDNNNNGNSTPAPTEKPSEQVPDITPTPGGSENDNSGETQKPVEDPFELPSIDLEPGEQVGDITDIVGGNTIKHGDEEGKELDSGLKADHYNPDGSLTVEDSGNAASVNEDKVESDRTLQETLEDIFGGPIDTTIGEAGYQKTLGGK